MSKLRNKAVQVIANKLRPIVDEVGKQLYNQLYVVCIKMNIDIKDLLNNCNDYNSFWENVAHFYNDYVDNTTIEEDNNV